MAAPSPWIWAIVRAGAGSGSGSGSGIGSTGASPVEEVGVTCAVTVKSAALSSVSTPSVRVRDFGSEFEDGAPAAAFSKVLEVP